MLRTMQGFRDFVMRGNVIDLSVGIVIGAAFTALVTSFTGSFIEPLLKVFGAGDRVTDAGVWTIAGEPFKWAAFVNALITFVMTAAVLYFLVVTPMNRLAERRRRGEEPPPRAPSEEVKLLTEIRDALVNATAPAAGDRPAASPKAPAPSAKAPAAGAKAPAPSPRSKAPRPAR